MRAEPYQITGFLDFARAVNRTIRQNLVLAFLYNAVTTSALSRPRCLAPAWKLPAWKAWKIAPLPIC